LHNFDIDSLASNDSEDNGSYEEKVRDLTMAAYNFAEQFCVYGVDGFTTGKINAIYEVLVSKLESFTPNLMNYFVGHYDGILNNPSPSSVSIIRNEKIGIGVLYLPKNSFIDMHDHPSMVVTSKILKGSITRYALDILHKAVTTKNGSSGICNVEDAPQSSNNMEFHALVRPKV